MCHAFFGGVEAPCFNLQAQSPDFEVLNLDFGVLNFNFEVLELQRQGSEQRV